MPIANIPPDMQDALGKFARGANAILESVPINQGPPEILYHYTNDAGLRGILQTGQLWFTDIFHLNDPSELKHGFGHAVEILRDKAKDGPPECKLFAEQVDGYLQEGISRQHQFICSFSSCGNDLGQWRAYADNGRGYALGFDGKIFEDAFFNEGQERHLEAGYQAFAIRYDDKRLAKIQQQLVEMMFPLISLTCGRRDCGDFITELLTSFTTRTLGASMMFKHEAYGNEKEYRFLQIHKHAPAAKFRHRPYSLVLRQHEPLCSYIAL